LAYQGVFYLLAATDLGSLGALGNLYIQYRVLFSIPQLDSGLPATRDLSSIWQLPSSTSFQMNIPWRSGFTKIIDNLHLSFPTAGFGNDKISFDVRPQWDVTIIVVASISGSGGTFNSLTPASSEITFSSTLTGFSAGANIWFVLIKGSAIVTTPQTATVTISPNITTPGTGTGGVGVWLSVTISNPLATEGVRKRKTQMDKKVESLEKQLAQCMEMLAARADDATTGIVAPLLCSAMGSGSGSATQGKTLPGEDVEDNTFPRSRLQEYEEYEVVRRRSPVRNFSDPNLKARLGGSEGESGSLLLRGPKKS
jgi:hypothetical protein